MKNLFVITLFAVSTVSCTKSLPEASASPVIPQTTTKKEPELVKLQQQSSKPIKVNETPIEKVFELQQTGSVLLIDTRPPIFYTLGHIDGAYSLPLKSFDKSFESSKMTIDSAIEAHKSIVIYCQNEKCPDSYIMAKKLIKMGYDVSIFKGGWELWKMSGL